MAQFVFDLGPNTTTFIVPGECFPTRYRATAHGISAAAGKTGSVVAQIISIPLLTEASPPSCAGTACSPRLGSLMRLFALFMLCGAAASLLVPETRGLTLEELAGEPPTSYNAGRNGSIGSTGAGRLNLLVGGRPAGFAYPRASGVSGSWRGARTGDGRPPAGGHDVDVETGKPRPAARRKHWWRTRRYENGTANSSGEYGMGCISSSTRAFDESADAGRAGATPGWNVGWGRIDRGAAPDNIRLNDVGGLIK